MAQKGARRKPAKSARSKGGMRPRLPRSAGRLARENTGPKPQPAGAIVPQQSVAGRALTLVVAIMSFLACLTVGAVSVVWGAADDWSNDLVREVTIQIRPVEGVDMHTEIDKAVALAQEFPGIGVVRALSDDDTKELLQPWLGSGLKLDELPVPRLIEVTVDDPRHVDLKGLKKALEDQVTGASLDDHSVWTSRLSAMAGAFVAGGFAILALVLASMVLSVVFATRAAMAGNKDVVSVLHFVGAEDNFIAREFQRHFLVLGLKGGIAGGLAACVCYVILEMATRQTAGTASSDQISALFGPISVGLPGYLGIIGVIFLVAVLTAVTSGLAVKAHLTHIE